MSFYNPTIQLGRFDKLMSISKTIYSTGQCGTDDISHLVRACQHFLRIPSKLGGVLECCSLITSLMEVSKSSRCLPKIILFGGTDLGFNPGWVCSALLFIRGQLAISVRVLRVQEYRETIPEESWDLAGAQNLHKTQMKRHPGWKAETEQRSRRMREGA